jgi:hypothetical protein
MPGSGAAFDDTESMVAIPAGVSAPTSRTIQALVPTLPTPTTL